MEPIPYFFDSINRSALIVRPKKHFKDWLTEIDAVTSGDDVLQDSDLYLIPDFNEEESAKKWLSKNFDLIFADQLNNWYTDESVWPKKRTFALFGKWFEYSFHLTILDTVDEEVEKL